MLSQRVKEKSKVSRHSQFVTLNWIWSSQKQIATMQQAETADSAGTSLDVSGSHPSKISLFPAQIFYCTAGKPSPCSEDITELPEMSHMHTYLFFIIKQVEMELRKGFSQRICNWIVRQNKQTKKLRKR